MRQLSLVLFALLIAFGSVQSVKISEIKPEITQSDTEEFFEDIYEYDENGNLIYAKTSGGYDFWNEDIMKYDDMGNCIYQHYSNSDGYWESWTREYNSDGQLLTEKEESSDGSSFEIINLYDEDGILYEQDIIYSTGEYSTSFFDENENYSLIITYDSDSNVISREEFIYGEFGLLEDKTTFSDGSWNSNTCTFDENGVMIETMYQTSDGYWMKSLYNQNGQQMCNYTSEGDKSVYDENENMIYSKSVYSEDLWDEHFMEYEDGICVYERNVDSAGNWWESRTENTEFGSVVTWTYSDGDVVKDYWDFEGNLIKSEEF